MHIWFTTKTLATINVPQQKSIIVCTHLLEINLCHKQILLHLCFRKKKKSTNKDMNHYTHVSQPCPLCLIVWCPALNNFLSYLPSWWEFSGAAASLVYICFLVEIDNLSISSFLFISVNILKLSLIKHHIFVNMWYPIYRNWLTKYPKLSVHFTVSLIININIF